MKTLLSFVLLILSAMSLYGADVSGEWTVELKSPEVGSSTSTLNLKQAGDNLTGTYTGRFGGAEIHGSVKGQVVTIDFEAAGGSIKMHLVGTLDRAGKKLEGTYEAGGVGGGGSFTGLKK